MKAAPITIKEVQGQSVQMPCGPQDATHIVMHKAGPVGHFTLPLRGRGANRNGWDWNGSTEAPTVAPSVLHESFDDGKRLICHNWISGGVVQYIADCNHELAGKRVALLDVDEAYAGG